MDVDEKRRREEEEKRTAYKKTTCPIILAGLLENPTLDLGPRIILTTPTPAVSSPPPLSPSVMIENLRLLSACLGPGCGVWTVFVGRCGLSGR